MIRPTAWTVSGLVLTASVLVLIWGAASGAQPDTPHTPDVPSPDPERASGVSLSSTDRTVLSVCEGIGALFHAHAEEIWPGYDLSRRPLVIYIPDRWALLLNGSCEGDTTGFGPPPAAWPDVGIDLCYRAGTVGNLVGQLVFGYELCGTQTVAIGFPDSLPPLEDVEAKAFGYIVHEAFHQYQDEHFGQIEWAREQLYPIEDVENAALAYLEMALLTEALQQAHDGNRDLASTATFEFLAIRRHRWERADEFIRVYESGKEVREGTARYVELRSLSLAGSLTYTPSVPGADPLPSRLRSAALPASLLQDLAQSMVDGTVPIEDMPRNRIYPVACAQALLLDYFSGDASDDSGGSEADDWKAIAEKSTGSFTFAELLEERLGLSEGDYPRLVERVKAERDYPGLLAAAAGAIGRHLEGYRAAIAIFESQPGLRIEITFDANGLYRSRVSSARKLVTDRGANEFCERYDVYTLQREGTFFELHDAPLLERNDYAAKLKTVAFYAPAVDEAVVSGGPAPALSALHGRDSVEPEPFSSIELRGAGFELRHAGAGAVEAGEGILRVDLTAR
jgi:hypothetical protein